MSSVTRLILCFGINLAFASKSRIPCGLFGVQEVWAQQGHSTNDATVTSVRDIFHWLTIVTYNILIFEIKFLKFTIHTQRVAGELK